METFLAMIPITVLLVGVLITKKIAEMLILSSFIGVVLVYRENFFSGYIDMLYGVLSNHSYQFVLIILIGFGAMIKLFQESGAISGFGNLMSKFARGPKSSLVIAWLMSIIMFVDDYLNTLTVSFSMPSVTDNAKIPREHLAFQNNVMAACLCVLIPFSSWTAFTVGLIGDQGLTYSDYIGGIPFMFYPFLMMAICLLLDLKLLPRVGALKDSYDRVAAGGPLLLTEELDSTIVSIEVPENTRNTSAWNAILPLIVLIVVSLIFDQDLVHGMIAALAVQLILYVGQRIMTIGEFTKYFFDGAKSMLSLALIIGFGFMLSAANGELGFFDIVVETVSKHLSPGLLPLLVFLTMSFAIFAASGYWTIQIIAIPIFMPLALAMNVPASLAVAAMMSGIVCGCNLCFYADLIFMTAAGTGVGNLRIIKSTMPYALAAALITAIAYLAAGFLLM